MYQGLLWHGSCYLYVAWLPVMTSELSQVDCVFVDYNSTIVLYVMRTQRTSWTPLCPSPCRVYAPLAFRHNDIAPHWWNWRRPRLSYKTASIRPSSRQSYHHVRSTVSCHSSLQLCFPPRNCRRYLSKPPAAPSLEVWAIDRYEDFAQHIPTLIVHTSKLFQPGRPVWSRSHVTVHAIHALICSIRLDCRKTSDGHVMHNGCHTIRVAQVVPVCRSTAVWYGPSVLEIPTPLDVSAIDIGRDTSVERCWRRAKSMTYNLDY